MSKIALTEGFSLIPEGTHIFQIVETTYKEEFGKLEIKMRTAKGQTHIERFSLMTSNGTPNEGAINAFSYFAKVALNDFSAQEVDPEELIGCFMECTVEHDVVESNRTPGKMVTFVRLGDKSPADDFDETPVPVAEKKVEKKKEPAPASKPVSKPVGGINLDDLLG